jgi:hypothetical protein
MVCEFGELRNVRTPRTKSRTPHVVATCGAPAEKETADSSAFAPQNDVVGGWAILLGEVDFGFGFDYEEDGDSGAFAGVETLPRVFH